MPEHNGLIKEEQQTMKSIQVRTLDLIRPLQDSTTTKSFTANLLSLMYQDLVNILLNLFKRLIKHLSLRIKQDVKDRRDLAHSNSQEVKL